MKLESGRVQEVFVAFCARGAYGERTDDMKSGNRLHLLHLFRRPVMSRLLYWTAALAVFLCGGISRAETFGSGANSFDIDFVTIGNPGNPPDASGLGSPGAVPYVYRIGT